VNRHLPKIAFVLALAIMLVVTTFIFFNLRTLTESNRKVNITLIKLNKLDHILAYLTDIETGPRGYVITGDEHFLDPYFAALSPGGITLHLSELRHLNKDEPIQQTSLAMLEELVAKKIRFTEKVIRIRKKRGFDATKALISTEIGNMTMEEIRRSVAGMKEREAVILQQRTTATSASLQNTMLSIATGGAASLLLLLLSFVQLNRETVVRRRIAEELQKLNNELNQRIMERTIALQQELEKLTQEKLKVQNLSRLYATLSQINEAIVRLKDRNELFKAVCRVAVDQGKLRLAWIGLLDSESGQVTPAVINDEGEHLPPLKQINIKEIPFKNGIMGSAAETGTVAFCNNIQTDPTMQYWRDMAISGGFHSAAAVPIRQSGAIIGLLNLYASEMDFFSEGQVLLLEEIEKDLSFALDTMELEKNHKRSELALRQSEQQFRDMFENNSAIMIIFDPTTGDIVDVNHSSVEYYGWSKENFRKLNLGEIDTFTPEKLSVAINQVSSEEKNKFIVRHRRADGSIRDVEVYATRINESGRPLMYSIIHDITDRMRLEITNAFHLSILQIAPNKTINELLQLTIDQAEKITESSIGFLHFVDDNQTTLTQQGWSTNTREKMCKAETKSGHYALDEAGIWANALRERRAVIHNNFDSIKNRKGVPEGHVELRREAVVPIFRNNKIVALIGIGNKPVDYNEDDITIVTMLADAAWDVIAKKITDDEHKILQLQQYVIENLAMHDSLTGLPNRRLLMERLSLAIAQCRRNKTMAALFILDLDKFKIVNDTLGHQIGDLLLKEVATRTLEVLRRSGDSLARLGGDEYVVLLPQIAATPNAVAVAEKINDTIRKPFEIEGHTINITCSIGIALFPDHGEGEQALIKNADDAMYQSKNAGRNRITVFGGER
jgi:diguanylate cyclase (GGDEF)-like protein/PAS domain S-box-containing protein